MYLTKETKNNLEEQIGKSLDELSKMDLSEEIAFVEAKTQKPIIFSKKIDSKKIARGNPLIVRKRICTMEEVDERITKLLKSCKHQNL